jgi:hypothetical protein
MTWQTGITTQTPERLIVDSGAIYFNYGLPNERVLGATRNGNEFVVEQEIREMPVDGARGPIAEMRRLVRSTAHIMARVLEYSEENILATLPGAVAANFPTVGTATHRKITRSLDIRPTHFFENVALVGRVHNQDLPVVCLIYNGLATSGFTLSTVDQDEAVTEVTIEAHFSLEDLSLEPWEIRFPIAPGS